MQRTRPLPRLSLAQSAADATDATQRARTWLLTTHAATHSSSSADRANQEDWLAACQVPVAGISLNELTRARDLQTRPCLPDVVYSGTLVYVSETWQLEKW